ncbi:MAG: hypothetical protein MJ160_00495 [Treponema sp.]|nr:hypothetical protein [Treponema sp.]
MLRQKFFHFILPLISFVSISCPNNLPEWIINNGQEIKNFPSWTTSCNAFSDWMDWQSEDGKRLHQLIDDTVIPDDYSGKFRIGLKGQEIIIGFNDQKGSCIELYNWYGKVTSWNDSIVFVEQEDCDNKFIYNCYCKKQKSERTTETNISKVEITKIDDQSFYYKQTVSEKIIIDCKFQNLSYFCVDSEQNIYTTPTTVPIKLCQYFPIEFFIKDESFLYFYPIDGSNEYKKIASHPNSLFKYIYCPEGYSFREINDEKTIISFNLLDSSQSDYFDYFEIQVNSKEDVQILFYRIENGTTILLNKLEKPDLKYEWLLNSETGETKLY